MPAVLLDTNILLHSADTASPRNLTARAAVKRLMNAGHTTALATQVLLEFWAVATRPAAVNGLGWPIARTRVAFNEFRMHSVLLDNPPEVLDLWLELVIRYDLKGKRIHDAHLLATMQANRVTHLLTFNAGDFPAAPEFTILNPETFLT